MVRGAAIWSDVWEDYQHYSRGGPHRAAVFISGGARTQLKRRLIAFWGRSDLLDGLFPCDIGVLGVTSIHF